ncbi:MAG: RNA polymerase sigma factor SigF [Nodosilinea sp.]|jgi:RNA polymerase sigma-B factor
MPAKFSPSLYEQSQKLLQQYQDRPDHELRNQLVQIHIGLVRQEAHRWLGRCHESSDELIQVGSMGLIRAIERFDLNQGYAFSSFAVPYIRGEIRHYLRDRSLPMRIPRRWQTLETRSTEVVRRLQQQLERPPHDREIATALGVSLGEWQEVKLAGQNRHLISLDSPLQGDDSISLMESLPDPRYKSFQLAQEDQIRLQQAMEQLERRTREILEFVFLYDLTQKETAERLGISVVTVSRRVKQGLHHLKSLMTHGGG